MAIELIWHTEDRTLELKCSGRVDGRELVEANEKIVADPRLADLTGQLCDMMAVESFDITPNEVERIATLDLRAAAIAPDLSMIVIACDSDFIFGYARMYEQVAGVRVQGWEVHVERTRETALRHLGMTSLPPKRPGHMIVHSTHLRPTCPQDRGTS